MLQVDNNGTIQLPDGSTVELNSETKLSYHPYWWDMKREVHLRGEAFFEVEKGEAFEVVSRQGKTQVLGTRFNIFARKNSYEVFCQHGKVRVEAPQLGQSDPLLPGMLWIVSANKVEKQQARQTQSMAWMEGRFYADNLPLARVIAEIERHFGIEIQVDQDWLRQQTYSGNFKLPDNPDQALELICAPFRKGFSHHYANQYIINL